MTEEHKSQEQLESEIEEAKQKVGIGAKYAHYKSPDKIYEVIGLGFLEETQELHVIYKAQYGKRITFMRPLTVWLETVEWDGQTVPRFTKI